MITGSVAVATDEFQILRADLRVVHNLPGCFGLLRCPHVRLTVLLLARPTDGHWPYLCIDAIYLKVREAGRII